MYVGNNSPNVLAWSFYLCYIHCRGYEITWYVYSNRGLMIRRSVHVYCNSPRIRFYAAPRLKLLVWIRNWFCIYAKGSVPILKNVNGLYISRKKLLLRQFGIQSHVWMFMLCQDCNRNGITQVLWGFVIFVLRKGIWTVWAQIQSKLWLEHTFIWLSSVLLLFVEGFCWIFFVFSLLFLHTLVNSSRRSGYMNLKVLNGAGVFLGMSGKAHYFTNKVKIFWISLWMHLLL